MDLTKEAIEHLLTTGRGQVDINENADGDPYFITPAGSAVGLAGFYPPRRIAARPQFQDVDSFIDYVKRFKSEATLIFAHLTPTTATLTAVLDYHAPGQPDYGAHQATFTTLETPDWKAWTAGDRKAMGQVEFASFLEEYAHLFKIPDGASLLELVRSLHGHNNARFSQAIRLDNGAYRASYEEDVVVRGVNSVAGGDLELPPMVKAGVQVFEGGPVYEVFARLKTRINERRLVLFYETINRPLIIRDNIILLTKQVAEQTGIIPLLGHTADISERR